MVLFDFGAMFSMILYYVYVYYKHLRITYDINVFYLLICTTFKIGTLSNFVYTFF